MKKLLVALLLFSSCATYRPPARVVYYDCEDELADCYRQNRKDRHEHNKQMTKAFFGTLFVVMFMHYTR